MPKTVAIMRAGVVLERFISLLLFGVDMITEVVFLLLNRWMALGSLYRASGAHVFLTSIRPAAVGLYSLPFKTR